MSADDSDATEEEAEQVGVRLPDAGAAAARAPPAPQRQNSRRPRLWCEDESFPAKKRARVRGVPTQHGTPASSAPAGIAPRLAAERLAEMLRARLEAGDAGGAADVAAVLLKDASLAPMAAFRACVELLDAFPMPVQQAALFFGSATSLAQPPDRREAGVAFGLYFLRVAAARPPGARAEPLKRALDQFEAMAARPTHLDDLAVLFLCGAAAMCAARDQVAARPRPGGSAAAAASRPPQRRDEDRVKFFVRGAEEHLRKALRLCPRGSPDAYACCQMLLQCRREFPSCRSKGQGERLAAAVRLAAAALPRGHAGRATLPLSLALLLGRLDDDLLELAEAAAGADPASPEVVRALRLCLGGGGDGVQNVRWRVAHACCAVLDTVPGSDAAWRLLDGALRAMEPGEQDAFARHPASADRLSWWPQSPGMLMDPPADSPRAAVAQTLLGE